MTRAGPSTLPGEAANPDSEPSADPSDERSQLATLSEVMPHSMTVNGSVTTSGGRPRAGGALHPRSASRIPLRRAISGPQYLPPRGSTPTDHAWYISNSAVG